MTTTPTNEDAAPERIWINIPKGDGVSGVDEHWWYENPMAFPTVEYVRANHDAVSRNFTDWMNREDTGDREQLQRCWNAAIESSRRGVVER